MREARELIAAWGKAADGYQREAVTGAAANMIMNNLRQSHKTKDAAFEELDDLVTKMKQALAQHHYHADGSRNDRQIVIPPLNVLLRGLI